LPVRAGDGWETAVLLLLLLLVLAEAKVCVGGCNEESRDAGWTESRE
jgi:hypothetical protein